MSEDVAHKRKLIKAKKELGKEITLIRKSLLLSLRELAKRVEIPPSNMKYIEDGVNAPSQSTYLKVMEVLSPSIDERSKLDDLYAVIRKTPPPDVCEIVIENYELFEVIRLVDSQRLSKNQIKRAKELFENFYEENKGGTLNGE